MKYFDLFFRNVDILRRFYPVKFFCNHSFFIKIFPISMSPSFMPEVFFFMSAFLQHIHNCFGYLYDHDLFSNFYECFGHFLLLSNF